MSAPAKPDDARVAQWVARAEGLRYLADRFGSPQGVDGSMHDAVLALAAERAELKARVERLERAGSVLADAAAAVVLDAGEDGRPAGPLVDALDEAESAWQAAVGPDDTCPNCHGAGAVSDRSEPCALCAGSGAAGEPPPTDRTPLRLEGGPS